VVGYKLHGSGPVRVLALHGWFGDATDFDALLAALDPRVYSLAAIDYRGYGNSIDLPGPFNIGQIAQDALTLAGHLGWSKFDVIGHSMGGKAALRLAALAPDHVRRLVGITPVFAAPVPFDCETADLFARAADDVSLRAAIISNSTGGRLSSFWANRMAQRSLTNSHRDAFAAYYKSWSGDNFVDTLQTVTHPILVVGGAYDTNLTEDVLQATWIGDLARCRALSDDGSPAVAGQPYRDLSRRLKHRRPI